MISMPRRSLLVAIFYLVPAAFAQITVEHLAPGTILIASEKLSDPISQNA